jgi:hypothetical protein
MGPLAEQGDADRGHDVPPPVRSGRDEWSGEIRSRCFWLQFSC